MERKMKREKRKKKKDERKKVVGLNSSSSCIDACCTISSGIDLGGTFSTLTRGWRYVFGGNTRWRYFCGGNATWRYFFGGNTTWRYLFGGSGNKIISWYVVVWRGCNMAENFRRKAVLRFSAVTPSAVTPSAVTGIVNYGSNSRRYLDRPITAGNHVDNIPEEHLDIPSILRKTKASTVFRTNTQAPQSITLLPSSDKAFIDSADTARQAKLLSDSLLSTLFITSRPFVLVVTR